MSCRQTMQTEGWRKTVLKAALKSVMRTGILPRLLIARVKILRSLGKLPKLRIAPSATIQRIFFSFPYHSVCDLILSLTLVDRIHERWPEAQIDVAVGVSMGAIVEEIPYVSGTFRLTRSRFRQSWFAAYAELSNATKLFRAEIADTVYDLAVAPRWNSADSIYSAYLAYLTGAPIRCGYSESSGGGSVGIDRFYTIAAQGGANEHETVRYTRVLSRCGLEPGSGVHFAQNPIRALESIVEHRKARGVKMSAPVEGKYVVFSPGATNPRRMWPITRFAAIGRALEERFGLSVIVVGGPGDIRLCQQLADAVGKSAYSTAGKTDPVQMLDLIADAVLFLGNDSGPAHIAGGLGVRTIVISPFPSSCTVDHTNSPLRFRPAGPRVHVLQPTAPMAPCFPTCQQNTQHCILQVSIEDVQTVLDSLVTDKSEFASDHQRPLSVS
jgi:ADP-heptose:LPS heptosyltransferase